MGRKTNSVSLRLKKTNRDYNNCWYGDILYAENFSKSLKVVSYLSQTLKTIGMPWPQASVIGAFKKASLLVCYLDPNKRKRLLEKSSKGYASARAVEVNPKDHAYHSKQSNTKGFFSLGQTKQNSRALLKPLEVILETSFSGPLSQQHPSKQHYVATPSFARGKHCKGTVMHERPPTVTNKNNFIVKNLKHKVSEGLSKKTTKPISYMYRGSLGLEFNQSVGSYNQMFNFPGVLKNKNEKKNTENKKFALKNNGITACFSSAIPCSLSAYGSRQSLGKEQSKHQPAICFSNTRYETSTNFSLKSTFFVKKKALSFSERFRPLPLEHDKSIKQKGLYNTSALVEKKNLSKDSISFNESTVVSSFPFLKNEKKSTESEKRKNQRLSQAKQGLQFFPYIFESTVINQEDTQKKKTTTKSGFYFFSDFFYSDKNHTPIICAFNKNLKTFGKKTNLPLTNTSFSCLSELVHNTPSCTKDDIKKILVEKEQLCKKKENTKTCLYGFYNRFSHFWGNVVSLSLYKSTNETSCALFLADTVSYLLERKVLFRSIKRQLLLELNQSKYLFSVPDSPKLWGVPAARAFENKKKVTGIRISCSGRVGGRSKKAQRSRKDTFMWGETGLHVFSSKLDFYKTHAETPFGVVGVQVWVCTK